jgi:hypothetical protein
MLWSLCRRIRFNAAVTVVTVLRRGLKYLNLHKNLRRPRRADKIS